MDASAVLTKTDMARDLLARRDGELARALRAFLIVVDGQRSLAQLRPMMDALGVTVDAVRHLVERGLLHPHPPASPVVRRSRPGPAAGEADGFVRVPAPALASKPGPAGAASGAASAGALAPARVAEAVVAVPTAAAEAPAPATPVTVRSLPAAKFYALNLVTLMLAGQDQAAREAVRHASTPQQLADWLGMCLDLVRDGAGEERAGVFAQKIWDALPEDLRERLPDWPH